MSRYAGQVGLILAIAFGWLLGWLYWTGEVNGRLFWIGVALYASGVFGSVAAYKFFEQRALDREVSGFEVIPHDDDK